MPGWLRTELGYAGYAAPALVILAALWAVRPRGVRPVGRPVLWAVLYWLALGVTACAAATAVLAWVFRL